MMQIVFKGRFKSFESTISMDQPPGIRRHSQFSFQARAGGAQPHDENDWNTLFANWTNNGFAGSPLKYSGYSGFNALLAGSRLFNMSWSFDGVATFFWSSTAYTSTKAWAHAMNDYDPSVALYPATRANAFPVRCIKD